MVKLLACCTLVVFFHPQLVDTSVVARAMDGAFMVISLTAFSLFLPPSFANTVPDLDFFLFPLSGIPYCLERKRKKGNWIVDDLVQKIVLMQGIFLSLSHARERKKWKATFYASGFLFHPFI